MKKWCFNEKFVLSDGCKITKIPKTLTTLQKEVTVLFSYVLIKTTEVNKL